MLAAANKSADVDIKGPGWKNLYFSSPAFKHERHSSIHYNYDNEEKEWNHWMFFFEKLV